MADNWPTPEECPEPFWHDTHRYCPVCTWKEDRTDERTQPEVEPATVPEEAVEAATRSIENDRDFAMREGGVGIEARMQAENAVEAAAPAIEAKARKQEQERIREALDARIRRYRSEAAYVRATDIEEAVRLERAANIVGSILHELDTHAIPDREEER